MMLLLVTASPRAAMAYLAGCWLLISVTIFTTPNFRHARKSKLACRNPYFRYRYDATSELGEKITREKLPVQDARFKSSSVQCPQLIQETCLKIFIL